jgi:hypothetical protein
MAETDWGKYGPVGDRSWLYNEVYLCQVEDAGFEAACDGVLLAFKALELFGFESQITPLMQQCLDYIGKYGNRRDFTLPPIWRKYIESKKEEEPV